jgi:ABC-type polysaccharide/polyol phosphate transport system ATPase subunit
MDEILGVGDAGFQAKCAKKIEGFRAKGVTILLVTHDLGQVGKMCDYVYWLEQGTVRARGKPSNVVAHYREFMAEQQGN